MPYQIEFIADSRFKGNRAKLMSMDRKLKKTGVIIKREGNIRYSTFENGKVKSWRKTYVIDKPKDMTWNQVMLRVNKIYAPKYKRVRF